MSLTKAAREQIKRYLQEKVMLGESDLVVKAVDAFGVSKNTVYRYLKEMSEAGILIKDGRNYKLASVTHEMRYHPKEQLLEEDRIFDKDILPLLGDIPANVENIWAYGFTEIMNNAIDHADANTIEVSVSVSPLDASITIRDDGIGIFENIRRFCGFPDLEDAVNELFKGKLTTSERRHSGEGIFFTSRVMDHFSIWSDDRVFSHDKYEEEEIRRHVFPKKGTEVVMELSNHSNKILREVFDRYADVDSGFTKTGIPLRNIFDDFPVSRSQAKRLVSRLDQFQEVTLDFAGIEQMGQSFAHEVFVVFAGDHPEVRLEPVNAAPAVQAMIDHVTK